MTFADSAKEPGNHMDRHAENKGGVVRYRSQWDSYFIVVRKVGDSEVTQDLYYCPWCGEKLPPSKADAWFDELEKAEIDPSKGDKIPSRYQDGTWWRDDES